MWNAYFADISSVLWLAGTFLMIVAIYLIAGMYSDRKISKTGVPDNFLLNVTASKNRKTKSPLK